jgi:hypothetical protein
VNTGLAGTMENLDLFARCARNVSQRTRFQMNVNSAWLLM